MSNPSPFPVRIPPERARKLAKRRDELIARTFAAANTTEHERATVRALAQPLLAKITR